MNDFVELVHKMRTAQKRFFLQRTQESLIAAKELERLVDAQIKELNKTHKSTKPIMERLPGLDN